MKALSTCSMRFLRSRRSCFHCRRSSCHLPSKAASAGGNRRRPRVQLALPPLLAFVEDLNGVAGGAEDEAEGTCRVAKAEDV